MRFSSSVVSKISEQRGSEQSIGHKLRFSLLLVEADVSGTRGLSLLAHT